MPYSVLFGTTLQSHLTKGFLRRPAGGCADVVQPARGAGSSTLCDSIWQVTLRSYVLCTSFNFLHFILCSHRLHWPTISTATADVEQTEASESIESSANSAAQTTTRLTQTKIMIQRRSQNATNIRRVTFRSSFFLPSQIVPVLRMWGHFFTFSFCFTAYCTFLFVCLGLAWYSVDKFFIL